MRRKIKFFSAIMALIVSGTFLLLGVFAINKREVGLSGAVSLVATGVSADVLIRHSRNKKTSLPYSSSMDRAVAATYSQTNDAEFRAVNSNSQEMKNLEINFPNDSNKRLEITDSYANYTYYVVITSAFPSNSESAILLDLKEGFDGFDGGFYTREIKKQYLFDSSLQDIEEENLVSYNGKNLIYIGSGQTVVISVSFTVDMAKTKARETIEFGSNFELIRYSGPAPEIYEVEKQTFISVPFTAPAGELTYDSLKTITGLANAMNSPETPALFGVYFDEAFNNEVKLPNSTIPQGTILYAKMGAEEKLVFTPINDGSEYSVGGKTVPIPNFGNISIMSGKVYLPVLYQGKFVTEVSEGSFVGNGNAALVAFLVYEALIEEKEVNLNDYAALTTEEILSLKPQVKFVYDTLVNSNWPTLKAYVESIIGASLTDEQAFEVMEGAINNGTITDMEHIIVYSLKRLEKYLFKTMMTDLILSETITNLGSLFLAYSRINHLYLPASVSDVEYSLMGSSLSSITVDEDNPYLYVNDGGLYHRSYTGVGISNKNTLMYFFSKQTGSYTMPEGAVGIAGFAFIGAQITHLELASVMDFAPETLGDNTAIKHLTFAQGTQLTTIPNWAFAFSNLESVILPNSLQEIAYYAFGQNKLKEIVITENIHTIGNDAFDANLDLKTVYIHSENSDIRTYASEASNGYLIAYADTVYSIQELTGAYIANFTRSANKNGEGYWVYTRD